MILTRMLALAGLALVIGAADSWIRPVQLRLAAPSTAGAPAPGSPVPPTAASDHGASLPTPPTASSNTTPTDQVLGQDITVEQARRLFDSGTPFIDARLDDEYVAERIQGAFHLTAAMFSEAQAPKALSILDPASPVVIYCSGGDCDASHSVGIRLQQAGFERIHIMVDGFAAWKKSNHPTESGPDALDTAGE